MTTDISSMCVCVCFGYKIIALTCVSVQEMPFGSVFHLRNLSLFMGSALVPGPTSMISRHFLDHSLILLIMYVHFQCYTFISRKDRFLP